MIYNFFLGEHEDRPHPLYIDKTLWSHLKKEKQSLGLTGSSFFYGLR